MENRRELFASGLLSTVTTITFNKLLGLLASAPAPGDNVLDEGVEISGVAHREVFEYPLDATTKALKIALRRRAFLKKLERGEG